MAYTRRLYKSSGDKLISGVAGGMAEYFAIDPVFVRLGWIASVFLTGGISILIYLAMIFVVPKGGYGSPANADAIIENNDEVGKDTSDLEVTERKGKEQRRTWAGIGLVLAGIVLLAYNLDFLRPVDWSIVGALVIIAVGAYLLFISIRQRR